jgi:hypothetical protein
METANSDRPATRDWSRFLAAWSLLTSLIYVSLITTILAFVMPAARPNPLGDTYFELMAARHAPILYKFAIVLDLSSWIVLGGLLVGLASLLGQRAPVRGKLVTLLASGLSAGFIGACLRLAGTSYFADKYFSAPPAQQGAVVHAYDYLLLVINILFSAGGLLGGIALLLVASAKRALPDIPRWSAVLIGVAGITHVTKGLLELATGADLGPLALLASVLMVVALVAAARKLYSSHTTPNEPLRGTRPLPFSA